MWLIFLCLLLILCHQILILMLMMWSAIDALTSLYVPVRSSFTAYESVSDAQGSFSKVPTRRKGQKSIFFWKSRVQTNDLRRLRKRDWTPLVLSLQAKWTQNDGEHGVWPNKWSWLELWQRKVNTALILRSKRESPWLLSPDSQGVGLCVNFNPVSLWVWRVIIS